MPAMKYATAKQRDAVAKSLKSSHDLGKMDTDTQLVSVGNPSNPNYIIVNRGDLGLDFVDREGKASFLNAVGEHLLLQFLINKQYGSGIVRSSKRIVAESTL